MNAEGLDRPVQIRIVVCACMPVKLHVPQNRATVKSNITPCSKIAGNVCIYSQTSVARTSLGPYKFVRDMDCLSHYRVNITPGQEANGDNLGESFRFSTQ